MLSPEEQYFADVCAGLGLAFTPWRFAYFTEWAKWEQGKTELSYWNPLNTTQHEPGSRPLGGDPNQNAGNPVQEYQDEATGVLATVQTLKGGQYYTLVLQSLAEQRVVPGSSNQIRTWGTSGFAAVLDQGWTPEGSKEEDVALTPEQQQALDIFPQLVRVLFGWTPDVGAEVSYQNALAEIKRLDELGYNEEKGLANLNTSLREVRQKLGLPV